MAGGPIHYADFGGSGQTMVLVHGLGGMHLNWMEVGDQLARRYRVVAPDLIGFGITPPAGRRATIGQNLKALRGFVDELAGGGPVILVGNSMGGLLSGFLAADRPDLVDRVVLVDPAVPNPRFEGISALVVLFFGVLMTPGLATGILRQRARRLGAEAIVHATLNAVCADPRRLRPELVAAHLELAERRIAAMPWGEAALVQAARSLLGTMARSRSYYERMRRVSGPALVIQGSEDQLVPLATVESFVERCPAFQLEVLEGVGHVPMMETPERFIRVLTGWLDSAQQARAG